MPDFSKRANIDRQAFVETKKQMPQSTGGWRASGQWGI
jgi:hypothetical protein